MKYEEPKVDVIVFEEGEIETLDHSIGGGGGTVEELPNSPNSQSLWGE